MLNRKPRLIALAIATALSTACSTTVSKPSACPHIVAYSDQFQDKLAAEVKALREDSALVVAMVDYGRLRNEIRACRP